MGVEICTICTILSVLVRKVNSDTQCTLVAHEQGRPVGNIHVGATGYRQHMLRPTALIVSKTITPSSSEHQGERKVVYFPEFSL